LILWGKDDKILEPKLYADKFISDLGTERAQLKLIEECGHVCHLEKPLLAAEEIVQFVKGGREGGWVQVVGPAYGEEGVEGRREGRREGKGWWAGLMEGFQAKGMEGGMEGGEEGGEEPCGACQDEEVVDCSNCDGVGSYVTYGRTVQCNGTCPPSLPSFLQTPSILCLHPSLLIASKGKGLMICRDCCDGEAEDIEGTKQAPLPLPPSLPPSLPPYSVQRYRSNDLSRLLRRRGGGHRRDKADGARSGGALGEGTTILLVLLVARIEVLEGSETRRKFRDK